MRLRIVVVALAALLMAVLPASASYADTSTSPTVTGSTPTTIPPNLESRLKLACARIPNLITRTNNLMTRLPAGPDTAGSIAWVQAKAQQVGKRHPELATALTNHVDVMTQKLAVLPNQLATLQKAQTQCQSLGYSA